MAADTSWDVGQRAANILAPELELVGPDTAGLGNALTAALRGAVANPTGPMLATARLSGELAQIPLRVLGDLLGGGSGEPVSAPGKGKRGDRRFADPAWTDNPAFRSLHLSYLALCDFARGLVDDPGRDAKTRAKARMAVDVLLDLVAPTNFLLTNPVALKRAFDTGGASVLRGARHFMDDLLTNGGRPRQVDTSPFRLGENLAATPAKIVYRNHLMELLQYTPQTPQVHATPLLCSPPWINKYYVMDLAPGRSFIEWAVQHGRTVFAISYRNPSADMSGTTMDDYLIHGPQQALEVVCDITGAETVDIVGLCLGGALTAITAAYLTQAGDDRVGAITLLNTMLDYTDPGALGVFTDADSVTRLEDEMRKHGGRLEGRSMAGTFDLMRANDLIFNYVVSNWLMGQDPPAFDILAWNADSTRLPAAMHSFYLRHFYVENRLAQGTLEIAGRQVDLGVVKSPTYVVSAENDHIVPWRSAYRTRDLVAGPVRFVLSSGGHIAGIVNPPSPKSWYLVGGDLAPTPDAWRAQAQRQARSWWEDWAVWSEQHAGAKVDPPPEGSNRFPVLGDGPGEYVRG